MADYYPLIARAIAGLDPSAPGESRRALYERARGRADPAAAQRRSAARASPRSPASGCRWRRPSARSNRRPPSAPARPRGGGGAGSSARNSFRRANPPGPPTSGAAPAGLRPGPVRGRPDQPRRRQATARGGAARRREPPPIAARPQPPQPQVPMADPQLPPRERPADPLAVLKTPRRRCRASRPRACAASATSQPTPTISAAPPRRPTATRARPTPMCRRRRRNSTGSSRTWRTAAPIRISPTPGATTSMDETERYTPPARRRCRQPPTRSRIGSAGEREPKRAAHGDGVSVQERDRSRRGADPGRRRHPVGQVGRQHRHRPVQVAADVGGGSAEGSRPRRPARPKIPDRVGQPSSSDNVAPVAQRVVLYDEDPSDPKGKQYVGSVIWRTEPVKASGNAEGRYRRARRHRHSRPQVQDDDVVPPQHRLARCRRATPRN